MGRKKGLPLFSESRASYMAKSVDLLEFVIYIPNTFQENSSVKNNFVLMKYIMNFNTFLS